MTRDKPMRRRWKRWAALVVVVVVAWVAYPDESSIQRAKRVQLDMTMAEVDEIMGASRRHLQSPATPTGFMVIYASKREVRLFFFKARLAGLCEWIGIAPPAYGSWPVTIGFDNSGRVRLVTRGDESISR